MWNFYRAGSEKVDNKRKQKAVATVIEKIQI